MVSDYPVCLSSGANTCLENSSLQPAPGYFCKDDVCYPCTTGSYGTDGKTCKPCPFATWSPDVASKSCGTSFTYSTPGLVKSYIPYGVNKIIVKVWGGGGGSDNSLDPLDVAHSGGGGGFSSCNLTVPMSNPVYVIVAGGGGSKSLTTNSGGFGGGGRGYAVTGYSPGGGGGRSAIQVVLNQDAITAGGGGGGADCFKLTGCGGGGGGGPFGLHASDPASGRGGNATNGGAAGKGFYCSGTAGSKYQGGNGCRQGGTAVSAGGGGGYYGGGGGSAFGNGSQSSNPPIYDVGGGGGGGSSYGGGCVFGSYLTLKGITGNGANYSRSGGISQQGYQTGVGVGGAPGGVDGGKGLVTITYVADHHFFNISVFPTSHPSSRPSGQPSGQPSSRPTNSPSLGASKRPTGQPTSAPSVYVIVGVAVAATVGGLSTQSAIIIFSAVGACVLCLFVCFSCYFQHKFLNKEDDKVHSLVEENFEDDDVILDEGDGGGLVENESMYYRQFGEADSPLHLFKDKDGNFIPSTARSSGGGGLSRMNSLYGNLNGNAGGGGGSINGSFTGRSRQSFVLRKSFGGVGSHTSRDGPTGSVSGVNGGPGVTRRSMGMGAMGEQPFPSRRMSFGQNGNKTKLVTRTSISTLGSNNGEGSVNGDITSRSGMTGRSGRGSSRSITGRSQSQVVSQVRVKSFTGSGPAPRMIKMLASAGNTEDIARSRYIAAHEDDVLGMQNFFRRAGLSMKKSIACAEESICLDANSPRKLFKYVHEVSGFSLMNLGMDKIDADMVLEVLNSEFSHKDISAAGAAAAAVAKMMGGTGGGGYNMANSDVDDEEHMMKTRVTTASMIQKSKPKDSSKARHIAEHEDDVLDMQEFFRFAGLSIQLSRECAEEAICMDANSPKKLYKYLEDVKGFQLTDLGMDAVDADMVFETLRREFSSSAEAGGKGKGKNDFRRISINSDDLDYKSDSSGDYDEKTESDAGWNSMKNKSKTETYDESVSPTYQVPPPRQPSGPPPIVLKHAASSVGKENQKLYQVPFLKAQPKNRDDGSDAFESEVPHAMEQQQGNMTGRSTDSVSTLGMKDQADNYYQVNQTSLHSLGVAVALNMLPPRPSSGVPGERPSFRSDEREGSIHEKQNDMRDFLAQVASAYDGPAKPPYQATEQTYEQSMGMVAEEGKDCYFTHDWSLDELKRSNQEQMLLIDEELRNRGLTTHCDKNRHPSPFSPEKRAIMTQNIDDAESILVFITQKFMGKVNGMDGNNDVCKMEFEYTLRTASSKIVLVILEERMRNVSAWKGQLRKCIGDSTKIIDMIEQEDEDIFNIHMDELIDAVAAAKRSPRRR